MRRALRKLPPPAAQHPCMDDDVLDMLAHWERALRLVLGTTAAAAATCSVVAILLARSAG